MDEQRRGTWAGELIHGERESEVNKESQCVGLSTAW